MQLPPFQLWALPLSIRVASYWHRYPSRYWCWRYRSHFVAGGRVIGGPTNDSFWWVGGNWALDGAAGVNMLQISSADNINFATNAANDGLQTLDFANFQNFIIGGAQKVIGGPGSHVIDFTGPDSYSIGAFGLFGRVGLCNCES